MADPIGQPNQDGSDSAEQDDEKGLDRRQFLRVGALLGACFADPKALRAALAYAKAQGKPVLTQSTLNRFIRDAFKKSPAVRRRMAADAKANVAAFLAKHFALNAHQKKVLGTFTRDEASTLDKAIDQAVKTNKPMQVVFKPAPSPSKPAHRPSHDRDPGAHVSPNAPAYKQHLLEGRRKAGVRPRGGSARRPGGATVSASKKRAGGAAIPAGGGRLIIQGTAAVGPGGPSAGVTVTAHLC